MDADFLIDIMMKKQKNKKNYLNVGYQKLNTPNIDFGMINTPTGTIKVEKETWEKYVKLRFEFEKIHDQLIRKIGKKQLFQLQRPNVKRIK